jgi:predicted transcriptional regulator
MKLKLSVRLSPLLFERLQATAESRASTKTAIIEAALERFLGPKPQCDDDEAKFLRRFESMGQKLEQIERDLRLVNETVTLHARYHLTVMPPMPQEQQHAACVLGFERFEAFAAQVATRVRLGTPLMKETIDRFDPTTSHMVPLRLLEGALVRKPLSESDHKAVSSTANGVRPTFSAAAREGGSNGRFPGTRRMSAQ